MESVKTKRRRKLSNKATGTGPVFEVRSAAKKTQIDFAAILGVSERALQSYESRGIFPLKADAMRRFLRYAHENDFHYSTIV